MKSPYIWIIIFLMLIIAGMFLFWPEPVDNTVQHQREIASKDSLIHSLKQQRTRIAQKIKSDSLQQAKERQSYQEDVEKLEARIGDLKKNPRVIYVRQTEPAVDSLISYQDSVISRQKARIDTLEVNLADLRLDARKIIANFEAQIQALGSIREAQTQIISQIRKSVSISAKNDWLLLGGLLELLELFF
jgi:hypothetical protein